MGGPVGAADGEVDAGGADPTPVVGASGVSRCPVRGAGHPGLSTTNKAVATARATTAATSGRDRPARWSGNLRGALAMFDTA